MKPRFHETTILIGEPVIGSDNWIGMYCLIDALVTIWDGCNISAGTHIYSHSTVRRCITNREYPVNDITPTKIGNNTFIGANSTILRGAVIGNNCVIGAGSVVLENTIVQDGETWVGNPARKVK